MPANTSPDNIEYPVSTDPVAPLETVFANMANSVQDAFDGFRVDWNDFEDNRAIQTFRWADATERAAQTGMQAGDIGYQIDTKIWYRYVNSVWVPWESDWITYTPTLSGVTLGVGGSVTAKYKYTAGRVLVSVLIQLGSSGAAITGSVTFSTPVTMATPPITNKIYKGVATAFDASATTAYAVGVGAIGTGTGIVRFLNGASGSVAGLSPTTPFTFAVNDALLAEFEMEPA